jgi:hypothetical protein
MIARECTGLWWLPGKEKEPVVGTLKISESGNLNLLLTGRLGPQFPPGSKTLPMILGSVENSPAGNKVTLVGCLLTGSRFGSFAGVRERYHASRGFFGAHLSSETSAFRFAALSVGGLTEWAHTLSGISVDYNPSSRTGEKVLLASYTRNDPVTSDLPGGKAALGVEVGRSAEAEELTITEKASLSIHLDSSTTADTINSEYVYPLQHLMTLVTDQAQKVEWFVVKREGGSTDLGKNPEIRVLGPRVEPEEDEETKEPVQRQRMLFTLKDIEFSSFFGNWLKVTGRYADACSIFFGLKYGPPAYIDMAFLGVVQSLHLYYSRTEAGLSRRAEEERWLRQILSSLQPEESRWLVSQLGDRPYPSFEIELGALLDRHRAVMNPLISGRDERFVTEVMNTLSYLIHRDAKTDSVVSHGAHLYWLMEKLRVLFKASFLTELGFSERQALSWFERTPLYQHMRELASARESERAAPDETAR